MSLRRIVVSLIVMIVLGGGLIGCQDDSQDSQAESQEPTVDVNTLAVDTGLDVVSAEGQIVPLRHVNLSFQVNGQVAEILVEEGDQVNMEDPLLRLEASDQGAAVSQAEAALAQAEATLASANAQLEAAEAGVAVAEAGVTTASAQLALLQADPTEEQIAASESSVAVAEAGIEQAAGNRDVVLEGPTEAQIRAAEAEVAAAVTARRPIQEGLSQIVRFEGSEEAEEQARIRLNAAEARVNAAQAALNELQEGATEAQRLAASAAVAAAAAQRDAAQAQLDLLLADAKPEQIRVAEIGVEQANASLTDAQLAVTQAEAGVAQAEAGVTQAQAALEAAQATLERMTLAAPFAGRVGDISVKPGEVVSPGVPVVALADFGGWLVKTTDLTELDVVSVAVGLPVDVRVDALPDEVIAGTVTDISRVSTLTRGDVTYEVTVRLEETSDLPLRWGMTAFVDIDVE